MSGEFAYVPTRHLIHRRPTLHGFTIVELLVVITIIVVLLALLAPAMDQAIYQAELVKCAGNLNGAARGVVVYAFDSQRHYPQRKGWNGVGPLPQQLALGRLNPNTRQGGAWDDRPLLKPYIPINACLNDPLSKPVNLEVDDPDASVLGSYFLWYSWTWGNGFPGSHGRFKLGDDLTFVNTDFYPSPRTFTLHMLLSDRDQFWPGTQVMSSHPDRDGVLSPWTADDEIIDQSGKADDTQQAAQTKMIGVAQGKAAWSDWLNITTHLRGEIDVNDAYSDGSVRRFNHVGNEVAIESDDRFTFVPADPNRFLYPSDRARVPKD